MFDFEKLKVYQAVKAVNIQVLSLLKTDKAIDPWIADQLKRSTVSILINLAEGAGRTSSPDKRHYLSIARASAYESAAIIDLLKSMNIIDPDCHKRLLDTYEEISKMLYALQRAW